MVLISPLLIQSWVLSAVLCNFIATGFIESYTVSLLPALLAEGSPIPLDIHSASWLASSIGLAMIVGKIVASILMDLLGRRLPQALMILPGIVGWTLIYFANDVTTLLFGRILCGISFGGNQNIGSVMMGEATDPKYRGTFLNLRTLFECLGVTAMHAASHFVNWRTLALLSIIPSVIALFIVLTWPESPSWLVGKNRFKESETNFYYLRGTNERAERELTAMIQKQLTRLDAPNVDSVTKKVINFVKKTREADFYKPVLIIFSSFMLLHSGGVRGYFPAFASDIVKEVVGGEDKSIIMFFVVGTDIIAVSSNIVGCILIKYFNRRTILFSSGFLSSLLLAMLALQLCLMHNNMISQIWTELSRYLLIFYFIIINLGCSAIPFILYGEIFPLRHRESGTAVGGILSSLTLTVYLKLTPYMLKNIHVFGTFFVYAIVMSMMLFYLYYALPETKDKTLQEIEECFVNIKRKRDHDSMKLLSFNWTEQSYTCPESCINFKRNFLSL